MAVAKEQKTKCIVNVEPNVELKAINNEKNRLMSLGRYDDSNKLIPRAKFFQQKYKITPEELESANAGSLELILDRKNPCNEKPTMYTNIF